MHRTEATETDCPTCNGAGELIGDAWANGRHVDDVQRCPECEGDKVVRVECKDCKRTDRLDRYDDDQGREWLCWECKEERENAPRKRRIGRADDAYDWDWVRECAEDDRRDDARGL